VDGADWTLIEINPRPGATLDIFRPINGSMLAVHVEACRGRRPATAPRYEGAAAQMIVYAQQEVSDVAAYNWPDWTADRQRPDSRVEAGAPLCTVLAEADTAEAARRLVEERRDAILAAFDTG
jgi:predicted ATP-grasp superfamily ATP-dependent carboligase